MPSCSRDMYKASHKVSDKSEEKKKKNDSAIDNIVVYQIALLGVWGAGVPWNEWPTM